GGPRGPGWGGGKRRAGTKVPRKGGSPPRRGTGGRFSLRPPGASTAPSSRAIPPTAGVSSTTTTRATSAPQTTAKWSPRTLTTLCCAVPSIALLRAVQAVSRVPEARDDKAPVIETAVDGCAHDVHVRMLVLNELDAWRCC